ncbi:MAG: hypothetical protein NTX53_20240 [candidate division WOR-3 bacterium]|nr:hypothetical protein [candidate division WOR-3 bacterium]
MPPKLEGTHNLEVSVNGLSSILQKHNLVSAVEKVFDAVAACGRRTSPALKRMESAALAHEWALPRLLECTDEVYAFFHGHGDGPELDVVGPKHRMLNALAVLDAYLGAMKVAGETPARGQEAQAAADFVREWQVNVQSFEEDD